MSEILVSALVVAIGGVVAALACPESRGPGRWVRSLAFGPALGFGMLSLCSFAALSLGVSLRVGGVFFLFLGLVAGIRLALPPAVAETAPVPSARRARQTPAMVILALVLLWICVVASIQARERPRGEWDAVAMWNARARLIERTESAAPEMIRRLERGQPAYPLYLPLANAAQTALSGEDGILAPRLTALWSLAGLLAAIVLLAPVRLGVYAAAAVGSTPVVIFWGLSQGADLALGYHLLLGIAAVLPSHPAGSRAVMPPWLAGFLLGLLPWIKEEGWLYAGAGALVVLSRKHLRTERSDEAENGTGQVWLGMLPGLLTVCAFKLSWVGAAMSTDFAARLRFEGWLDPDAWWAVARGYLGHFADLGSSRWSLAWPALAVLWALGAKRRLAFRSLDSRAAGLGLVIALGWAVFFPISPFGPEVHVRQALERLLLQPFPLLVILALRHLDPRPGAIKSTIPVATPAP